MDRYAADYDRYHAGPDVDESPRLTAFRLKVLCQVVVDKGAVPPSGYRTAGQDAARWWGAVRWLREHGLCEPHVNGGRAVYATDAGRELVRTSNPT